MVAGNLTVSAADFGSVVADGRVDWRSRVIELCWLEDVSEWQRNSLKLPGLRVVDGWRRSVVL